MDDVNAERFLRNQSYTALAVVSNAGITDVVLQPGSYWLVGNSGTGLFTAEVDAKQTAENGVFVETTVNTFGTVTRQNFALLDVVIEPGFYYVMRGCATDLVAEFIRADQYAQGYVFDIWDAGASGFTDTIKWAPVNLYQDHYYLKLRFPVDSVGAYVVRIEKWKALG